MKSVQLERFRLILLAAVATSVSLFWFWQYTPQTATMHDAKSFFDLAVQLAQGHAHWLYMDGSGSVFLDIGFPNFLSWPMRLLSASDPLWIARIANHALFIGWVLTAYGTSTLLFGSVRAFYFSLLFAFSPMVGSFSGVLYSETFALFGSTLVVHWMIARFCQRPGIAPARLTVRFRETLYGVVGLVILMTTKSVFFYFAPLCGLLLSLKKHWREAAIFIGLFFCLLPIHRAVQKGGRGVGQLALQSAKLVTQDYPLLSRCMVYNLSDSLGTRVFPQSQGACTLISPRPEMPDFERSFVIRGYDDVNRGIQFQEVLDRIRDQPFKYLWVLATTLPTAFWIDGVHPLVSQNWSGATRLGAWLVFKVLLSTLLWINALSLWFWAKAPNTDTNRHLRRACNLMGIAVIYTVSMHLLVRAEQRHFMPLLPILYLMAAVRVNLFLDRRRR